jgi:hypothetical protein
MKTSEDQKLPEPPENWSPEQKRLYYLETLYSYSRFLSLLKERPASVARCIGFMEEVNQKLRQLDGADDDMDYMTIRSISPDGKRSLVTWQGKADALFLEMHEKLGAV